MNIKKTAKTTLWIFLIVFIFMNIVAFFHAYKFTHFAKINSKKTESPKKLSTFEKFETVLFGVNNPRPTNTYLPSQKFETLKLQSNKEIECWTIKTDNSKGTVILFHGYGSKKSSLLNKSDEFLKLGYDTLLVDFMGSGSSEGNQTTIGFKEAEEVKTAFEYLEKQGEKNIYLFGNSLGAVAVMKAMSDFNLDTKGIILECPFGSMYKTTCARFSNMNVPSFPMAGLLVFWGGVQNGFWAFGHKPTEYAKNINAPTLLLYGEKDDKVSREEIDEIYSNLNGTKQLKTFKLSGHEDYLNKYKEIWIDDIHDFLKKN